MGGKEKYFQYVAESLVKETKIFDDGVVLPPFSNVINIAPHFKTWEESTYPTKERFLKGLELMKRMYRKYVKSKYGLDRDDDFFDMMEMYFVLMVKELQ